MTKISQKLAPGCSDGLAWQAAGQIPVHFRLQMPSQRTIVNYFKSLWSGSSIICDPTQQKVPTFTKINFRFIVVSRRLSGILFRTIYENNNFGLLASVLEGWKRGKNCHVPQNSIKIQNFFVALKIPNECLTKVSSCILNFDGVGEWEEPGCPGHSILPTLLTSWLREPPLQKIFGFWILHSHLQL